MSADYARMRDAEYENEKLRDLLSQTVPFIRSAACDEQREDLLHEVLAALRPRLSPEKGSPQ